MSLEENKALARRFLRDVWSEGKMAVIDEIIAPNFVMLLPVKPYKLEGPEGLKRLTAINRNAFHGLNYDIEDGATTAEGDRVVMYWKMTGKHLGKWGDSEPSGKDCMIHGMSMFRVANGKITECRVQNEGGSLLRQVGTLPPEGTPEYKLVEANKAHVLRYIQELLMKGNFAVAPELVTPAFKIDRSALPDAIAGPEGLHKQMDMLKKAFPDLELKVVDLFAAGDKVAARFEAPGTHVNEFAGVPGTGAKVTWRGIVIYHVVGGKVDHAWADWDDSGLVAAVQQAAKAKKG